MGRFPKLILAARAAIERLVNAPRIEGEPWTYTDKEGVSHKINHPTWRHFLLKRIF